MEKRTKKNNIQSGKKAINSVIWLLLAILLCIGLLIAGLYFAGNWFFYQNRHFTLRVLDLQENGPGYWGNKHTLLAARAGLKLQQDNLWKIDPAKVRNRIMEIPSIASCEIRRILPDTLQVTISERIPRAAIENPSSPRVLAADGTVLNRYESLAMPGALPVITGFGMAKAPAAGSKCPAADNALKLLNECLRNYPDISIIYINIARKDRMECFLRYRNRRTYKAILPAEGRFDYLLSALQSTIIDVLKNNDPRTTFDLSYRGQVIIRR